MNVHDFIDKQLGQAAMDDYLYEKGTKVTDAELPAVSLTHHAFHRDRNYTIAHSNSR